jgi:pyruvate,orthophosphate dikinase
VSGSRNALPISELNRLNPLVYKELLHNADVLERHYRDLCDIEFTVERGRLWMLQTRVGKRTPAAAFRIACQLASSTRSGWTTCPARPSACRLPGSKRDGRP